MTLRVDISIIPYGQEDLKSNIFRLDISNHGEIRNEGFGNVICKYKMKMYRYNNETMQRLLNLPELELENEYDIPEHNRKDGAIELVRKACEIIERGKNG